MMAIAPVAKNAASESPLRNRPYLLRDLRTAN